MEEAFESVRGKGPIAALYIETPANPTNGMVDLERAQKIVSGLQRTRKLATCAAVPLPMTTRS